MDDQIGKLRQLQKHRASPVRELSIAGLVRTTAGEAVKMQRQLGEMIEVWERLVPAEVASHTALTGLRRGVLHVAVDSSAAGFELDRLLRGGLLNELRHAYRGSLARVKTRVDAVAKK